MNTAITLIKTCWDINGNGLPPGNYFFLVKNINNLTAKGIVTSERINNFNAEYEFNISDFINMIMSSNIRLLVLSGIDPPNISEQDNNYSKQNDNCAICLNDLSENRYILGCAHHFHENCILKWLEQNNSCPICRHPVTSDNTIVTTENIILNNRPRTSPVNRRRIYSNRRQIVTSPINRRRRRQRTTPPRRRRRRRNTIIEPQEFLRRNENLYSRQREYNEIFSSRNITSLLR